MRSSSHSTTTAAKKGPHMRRAARAAATRIRGSYSQAPTPLTAPRAPQPQPQPQPAASWTFSRGLAAAAAVVQLAAATAMAVPPPAAAVLNSPNAQIARSSEAALRRSIPAFNPLAAELQRTLEDIQFMLRIPQRKPWGSMADDVDKATRIVESSRPDLLRGVPADRAAESDMLAADLLGTLQRLSGAIEIRDPDRTSIQVARALKYVAELELEQAPGLPFAVPKDLRSYPVLTGRATLEVRIRAGDGRKAFLDPAGGSTDRITLRVEADGYSAPLSAGALVSRALQGGYNGIPLRVTSNSVLVGRPGEGAAARAVPLEILPLDSFEPMYKVPLDVQSGELPRLPLSIPGAVAFALSDGTVQYSDPGTFFIYKFDKQQSGLSGLSFDEGQFAVMGYVVGEDADLALRSLATGDVVERVEVVQGKDKLVVPPQ